MNNHIFMILMKYYKMQKIKNTLKIAFVLGVCL